MVENNSSGLLWFFFYLICLNLAPMVLGSWEMFGDIRNKQLAQLLFRASRYFGAPSDAIMTKRNQLYQLHGNTSHFEDFGPILGLKLGGLGQKVKNKSCSMSHPGLSLDGICQL